MQVDTKPQSEAGGEKVVATTTVPSSIPSHCQNSTFIDSLPEPFLGIARECIPLDDTDTTDQLPSASIRADLLEIQLRSQLLSLVHDFLVDTSTSTSSTSASASSTSYADALEDVGIFWKCSLELCLHIVYFSEQGSDERYQGMSVRKLPLLLLEDALDALPLQAFQDIWQQVVEPALPILWSDLMWNPTPKSFPCSLPFIKLCNKFLKKIETNGATKTTTSSNEWPGRILLTLAQAFTLSDKSATKIWGSFNTDNVTEFETPEDFEAQQKLLEEQQQAELDHKDTTMPSLQSLHHPHQTKDLQTYSFYETFWSVQQDFSNPSGIKVADFLERMKKIMAALESHPLIRSHATATSSDEDATDNASSSPPPQVKYLTSSHLLPIQLGDPIFRIHFLTQFLIVENHLSAESPALGAALMPLQKRAKDLIRHIQPLGQSHLHTVSLILNQRETHWRQWKKNKCQPDLEIPLVAQEDSEDAKKRKRLLDGPLGSDATAVVAPSTFPKKKKMDEEELLIDFILHEKKDLKATCAIGTTSANGNTNNNKRDNSIPTLEGHLESYVDALDPDAGIEPEYHPKNDSLFTWRALRLLSRDHLGKFHMINHKGDFENMVRHIYSTEKGIDIPGEAAVEEHPLEDDEEEEVNNNYDNIGMAEDNDDVDSQDKDGYPSGADEQNGSVVKDEEMDDADGSGTFEIKDDADANTGNGGSQARLPEGPLDDDKEELKDEPASDNIKMEDSNNRPSARADMERQRSLTPIEMEPASPGEDGGISDEPTRVKEMPDSDDEGEIDENKAKSQKAEPGPDERGPSIERGASMERPPPEADGGGIKPDPARGEAQHTQHPDRRDEDRGGGGKQQQNRRGGNGPKGRRDRDSNRSSSPPNRGGGGGRGGHRDQERGDGHKSDGGRNDNRGNDRYEGGQGGYNSYGDSGRDPGRNSQPRHPRVDSRDHGAPGGRGGGGDIRDHGAPGGRGGGGGRTGDSGGGGAPGRRDDDRWDDRRGGGGGGPGRRDDRRSSGGGGGHRRGRGDGRRRR